MMDGSPSHYDGSEIAIIGMAGRFPGAPNLDIFWRNLRDGVESIAFLTSEELELSGVDPVPVSDPQYVKAASVLDDVELFDAAFFGYTPREAEIMDPQQRVFLECAWEALERAGYDPETYTGMIGLFAGARSNSYLFNLYSHPDIVRSQGAFQIGLGNDLGFLASRVSYKLNLKGPSYAVHSACSTSLLAVHLACQSLLIDECQIALAGGVAITVPQKSGYLYHHGGIVSPDGHCRAFDAEARGTIFGSGVGLVVLKRLEDARADGDTILAVIRGSAINNDGALKASFTAPSVYSQTEVILEALANAGVDAETISYVEAHGTGTTLGDPLEVRALTKAFRSTTDRTGFCALGSVKTNIGHLDAAAGISSLIKTVLALQHRQIPPTLHFRSPNPQIDFANTPFYVSSVLAEWPANEAPRRAGVSSFGIGGTNAHVILEEPPPGASDDAHPWQLLVLSARTATALDRATANLAAYLEQHPAANLADVAYTLQVGRQPFGYRRMLVAEDRADALRLLAGESPHRVFGAFQETQDRPVVFLFPGQGAQYVSMARTLYYDEPVFRAVVDRCAELLLPHLERDIRDLIYPHFQDKETSRQGDKEIHDLLVCLSPDLAADALEQTWLTQPALFVVEYALTQLWMEWGVRPTAMIGHSIGEYVAACLAGVLTLEDALALVAARGRLMQRLPTGAMLAVPLAEEAARARLGPRLDLAAVNGPELCVVAGPPEAVAALERQLAAEGISGRRLATSHAFHSAMIDPVVEPFAELVGTVALQPPQIPFLSNVTGTWISAAEATDPRYWAQVLRQTVRFGDGVRELLQRSGQIFVEVGPGHSLSRLVQRHPDYTTEQVVLPSLPPRDNSQHERAFVRTALGKLWLAGALIDWPAVAAHQRRQRIPLPTYPFERRRYWIEPNPSVGAPDRRAALDKQPDIADWFSVPSWKRSLPQLGPQGAQAEQLRRWLVFAHPQGFGASLARWLQEAGHTVVTVLSGSRFERRADGSYTIDPRERESYTALINDLRGRELPTAIVHLWNVTTEDTWPSGLAAFDQAQDHGFYSLLWLAQGLGELQHSAPLQLLVVSDQLHDVTGDERLCPAKATLLGPCKVIPREYANITCRSIDIVAPAPGGQQEAQLIEQIIAELDAAGEPVVAYRGRRRWTQHFEAVRLGEPAAAGLREAGVYMITGGTGGVGLALAEYLARTLRARLVLIGRRAVPARAEWHQWLETHAEQDGLSRLIRAVQACEASGAQVLILSADVADPNQMQAVIEQARARFGALHGVIHAAGVAGGGLMQIITRAMAEDVLRPKAKGALVLDVLLGDADLDFLALFSSVSAVLGEFGQADYCAANAFLDALAHDRRARNNCATVSINWDTWKEVGMTVAMVGNTALPEELRGVLAGEIEKGLTPQEGVEVFRRVLAAGALPQVIVSTKQLQAAIDYANSFTRSRIFEAMQPPAGARRQHQRPNIQSEYVAPRDQSEQRIAAIWQSLLGIEQVGVHDNFFDLGGQSLLATMVVERLRDAFDLELPINKFFELPTVAGLALAVADLQAERTDQDQLEVLRRLSELSEEEIEQEIRKRMG